MGALSASAACLLDGGTGIAQAAPRRCVVTSFSILADMARQAGSGAVDVIGLVPPDADVHVYQPRPADMKVVAAADVLVENGLGLEGWLARLAGASGFKGTRIAAAAGVTPRAMREGGGAMTDDPHAWQDPRNGVIYARNFRDGLIAADPAGAEDYRANAAAFITEIERVDAWITAQFATIPAADRRIITSHDAFGYYGARYGIALLAPQGMSTDAEPSAKAIAALVAQIKQERVRAVFIESMTDPRMAKMIARESGAVLGGTVYSDSLSPMGGPAATYLTMLRHNTALFAGAMRGVAAPRG